MPDDTPHSASNAHAERMTFACVFVCLRSAFARERGLLTSQDMTNTISLQAELDALNALKLELLGKVDDEIESVKRKLARGTGDHTEAAAEAVKVAEPATDADRVLATVAERALTYDEIAKAAGITAGKLSPIMQELRAGGKVTNLGTEDHPRWFRRVGDDAPAEQLVAAVRYMISDRPMTLQELIHATGARQSRVNGARVQLVRDNVNVVNYGTGRIARWFIPKRGAKRA